MTPDVLGLPVAAWMFPALFALIFLGIPVALALIATAAGFGWLVFGDALFAQLFGRIGEVTGNFALAAVPAFILMGSLLERAGIAEGLFRAMQVWLGRLPGGLAMATMAMAGLFAATTGIIGAVEIVIGMMAIPPMAARGYDRGLVAGTITAGGSLGTIIPPSIVCVIYGSIGQVPINDLFAGVLLPGVLMVALFMGYIGLRCRLRPADGPPALGDADMPLGAKLRLTAVAIVPVLLLIAAVLGSILGGVASPTEAAAVGVLAVLALAAANGRLSVPVLADALRRTVQLTSMIMLIVLGGTMFAGVFYIHGGGRMVAGVIDALALGPSGMVALFLAVVFVAGFVVDWATAVLICVPIFTPLLRQAGIDPLWFAVAMIVVLQTSYLTPPMAPAIFYFRSIAPPEFTYSDMYRGVVPFVVCQGLTLAAVLAFPGLATWLPRLL
jgi:tripartite ATP-independent transporter DctM subunit